MRNLLTVLIVLLALPFVAAAQQWSGLNTTSDPIYRTGNVGLGIGSSPTSLMQTLNGNLVVTRTNVGSTNTVLFVGGKAASGVGCFGCPATYSGQVGINTYQPLAGLHVSNTNFLVSGNSGENVLYVAPQLNLNNVANAGAVGIGTRTPHAKLEITGNPVNQEDRKNVLLKLGNSYSSSGLNEPTIQFSNGGYNSQGVASVFWNMGAQVSGYPAYFRIAYNEGGSENELFRICYNGWVGIGTSSADLTGTYKLSVNGCIRAKEIKVNSGWSDFVFDSNYKLMSLSDLKLFIFQNNHLPGIPSAADVQSNGVSLGESSALLLQKIEELTLYIIQQQKEIDELKEALK